MGTLYHTAPWFDDDDDESAIDANAVADPTNEEKGCFPFSCLSPWPGPRSLACEETPIKQSSCPSPFHWQHGPTRTETTTTTTTTTRGIFTLSRASARGRRQGHCDRCGECRRGVRGQERLGGRHAQETRGENLLEAGAGQPTPGSQHAQPNDKDGRGQVNPIKTPLDRRP